MKKKLGAPRVLQGKVTAPELFIASDHGGYQLKRRLIRFIMRELQMPVMDMGPYAFDKDDDYPVYVRALVGAMKKHGGFARTRGILICKNGIGVCMAANKARGIRAGIGYNIFAAQSMRAHDNTNVLCMPAKALTEEHALAVARAWLTTPFSGAVRHQRRLRQVAAMEKNKL